MSKVVLDAGVWVEYINKNGRYHAQAKTIVDRINNDTIVAAVSPITLSEIYYVSERVYKEVFGASLAKQKAEKLYNFIYYHPNTEVVPTNHKLDLMAGEIKSEYNIAISDCYSLALSEKDGVPVVFRHVENEMMPRLKDLKKDFNIIFLEEYV